MAKLDPIQDLIMRAAQLGCSPAGLLADYLAGGEAPSLAQGDGRTVIFTELGRAAILLAARLWGIGKEDEVLVPAYNCGSDISPLIATGARVSMYRVDSSVQIDFADLRRRITHRTRLIHVIHYFGRPTDLEDLATLCRSRNIKLLEDCALSLFCANTGRTGDGAIFSFHKTLATHGGGALTLRDTAEPSCQLPPSHLIQTTRGALSLVRKWASRRLPAAPPPPALPSIPNASPALSQLFLPDIPASYYCNPNAAVHQASRLSRGALRRANVSQIVQSRRAHYESLRRSLLNVDNISLPWTQALEDGISPLGLPVLVQDKPLWCNLLNVAGIPVSSWWSGCHKGLNWSDYPEALALKAQLILLPVHQGLENEHIAYIAHTVRRIAEGGNVSPIRPSTPRQRTESTAMQ